MTQTPMPDTTLTSAELAEALANLTDAFLLRHGCFPLDRTTPGEKLMNDAMREAYRLIGQPATPERDRKLSLARAGLEAGKAEESMRERAARLEAEAAALRKRAFDDRPLPDFWRVGQRVRLIKDKEWAYPAGTEVEVVKVRDPDTPAKEYQVFWTSTNHGKELYWTTPDEVELVQDVPAIRALPLTGVDKP